MSLEIPFPPGGKILRTRCGGWQKGNHVFQTQHGQYIYKITESKRACTKPPKVQTRQNNWERKVNIKSHSPLSKKTPSSVWCLLWNHEIQCLNYSIKMLKEPVNR